MPLSDKKKCQTLINLAAEAAEQIRAGRDKLVATRTAFQAQGVDPAGTPLEGNVAAVSLWIDDVTAVADSPVALAMIAAKVPTHRGAALEVT